MPRAGPFLTTPRGGGSSLRAGKRLLAVKRLLADPPTKNWRWIDGWIKSVAMIKIKRSVRSANLYSPSTQCLTKTNAQPFNCPTNRNCFVGSSNQMHPLHRDKDSEHRRPLCRWPLPGRLLNPPACLLNLAPPRKWPPAVPFLTTTGGGGPASGQEKRLLADPPL